MRTNWTYRWVARSAYTLFKNKTATSQQTYKYHLNSNHINIASRYCKAFEALCNLHM